jgi:uncharacterized membrane protein
MSARRSKPRRWLWREQCEWIRSVIMLRLVACCSFIIFLPRGIITTFEHNRFFYAIN